MSWREINLERFFTLEVDRKLECMGTSYSSAVVFMMLAEAFDYRTFLEIGTGGGYVSTVMGRYFEIKGGGRVHTCDPEARNRINQESWVKAEVRFFHMSSQDYFKQLPPDVEFDMVFIDGDHARVGEDFILSLPHLSKFGTIVLHDLISIPTVAKFLYETLPKLGNFELLSLTYQTGYAFVRRKEDWKKLLTCVPPGHQPKRWIDLSEL